MQGIYIDSRRPKSKREIRDVIAQNPHRVSVERTAMFGDEYGGGLAEMPEGTTVTFTGPDPHNHRKFYGTIVRNGAGNFKVS